MRTISASLFGRLRSHDSMRVRVARARSATEVEGGEHRPSTFVPGVTPLLRVASQRQIDTHPHGSGIR